MRASSFWLLVVPLFLLAGGVWQGWVKVEMETVRFSRTQVDLATLQKEVAGKVLPPENAQPRLSELLTSSIVASEMAEVRDCWNNEYRAALLLDGSGKVAFFSTGPDGESCLNGKSGDDIFAGNSFDGWASSIPGTGGWRAISWLAGGFLLSQIITRAAGAFPRPPVED